MSSYALWWIEIVAAVIAGMCLVFVIGEAAAFLRIARIRRRDGGIPVPRTKEEYLLLFPRACARCLSRRGRRVKGWHLDGHGASEFVDTWQCAECAFVAAGNLLAPAHGAETMERSVRARQRWFISTTEAERIERPRLGHQDVRMAMSDGAHLQAEAERT
jgi:hypothetical protein